MGFTIKNDNGSANIILGNDEFSGVRKVAEWVADDFFKVIGTVPEIKTGCDLAENLNGNIVAGTLGRSSFIEEAAAKLSLDLSDIKGKREVYKVLLKDDTLIVVGSDKRGTIYGLLHISESIGVSPMVYFGDVKPLKYRNICFSDQSGQDPEVLYADPSFVSKEPSVKYRGFFINDEWPAFGNWCNKHFEGFSAKCYEKVFEYLLRLKGNYMWPAMWSSVFSFDGPGTDSAELADELGIVMGTSHHEPCCRAGEEFVILNKDHPEYGTEWSFLSNREGITKFWEDGLKRNGQYENIITVGMRGERDSKLFADAKLSDNINVLKDVINCQKKLIVDVTGKEQPMMLAIYKEVEEYYKGNKDTPGLKEWDGLDGITLMLCDDNFGNLRLMMDDDKRDHKGGYGMYYHFDYHGGPVSYEWINSSYLPKIWEQMSTAYDFGIRDIWIVNVGDLKNQELPLEYFMDLAYDFEKYGTEPEITYTDYLRSWVDTQFKGTDDEIRTSILEITEGYTRLNNITKPEVLNEKTYSITGFSEAYRVLSIAKDLEKKTDAIYGMLDDGYRDTFTSLIGYQAKATFNLIKMQIFSALNIRNALQGRVTANKYARLIKKCIDEDKKIVEEFHTMLSGKWYGMGMSKHIGFRAWNEEGCRLPVMVYVEPEAHNDVVVTDEDSGNYSGGGDWTRHPVRLTGFDHSGTGNFSIASCGMNPVTYTIECNDPDIEFYGKNGNRYVLSGIADSEHDIFINVKAVKNAKYGRHEFMVKTSAGNIPVYFEITEKTLIENGFSEGINYFNGMITGINALNYYSLKPGDGCEFRCLEHFGRVLPGEDDGAIKAFPQERPFENGPVAEYKINSPSKDTYRLVVYTAPSNPSSESNRISFAISVNGKKEIKVDTIPEGYNGGENSCGDWCRAVLENIRKTELEIELEKGDNSICIRPLDPGFVLEKMVICRFGISLPESRLGALNPKR